MENLSPLALAKFLLENTTVLKPAFQADPKMAVLLALTSWAITGCNISYQKTVRIRKMVLAAPPAQNAAGDAMVESWVDCEVAGLWGMDQGLHGNQLILAGWQPIEAQAQAALALAYTLKDIQDWNAWDVEATAKVRIALGVHKRRSPIYQAVAAEINELLAAEHYIWTVGRLGPVYTVQPLPGGEGSANQVLHVSASTFARLTDQGAGFACGWYEPVFYKFVHRPQHYLATNLLPSMHLYPGKGSFLDRAFTLFRRSTLGKPKVDQPRMQTLISHYEAIVGCFSGDPNGWAAFLEKYKLKDTDVPKAGIPATGTSKGFFEKLGDMFSSISPPGWGTFATLALVATGGVAVYYAAKTWGKKKGAGK